jgi:hypothetical protein
MIEEKPMPEVKPKRKVHLFKTHLDAVEVNKEIDNNDVGSICFYLRGDVEIKVNQITEIELGWDIQLSPGMTAGIDLCLPPLSPDRCKGFPDQRIGSPESGITLTTPASVLYAGTTHMTVRLARTLNYVNAGERVLLKRGDPLVRLRFPMKITMGGAENGSTEE